MDFNNDFNIWIIGMDASNFFKWNGRILHTIWPTNLQIYCWFQVNKYWNVTFHSCPLKQSAVNLQSGGQCFIVELWYGTQSSKENAQQFRQGIPPTNQCPITDNNGVWLHPLDRGTLPSFSKITYECSSKGKRSFLWHNVLQEDVSHVNQPKHGLITRRPRFVIMIAKTPKRIEIAAAC